MSDLAKSTLVGRLVGEFGYPAESAEFVATKLQRLQPDLQAAFTEWWRSGSIPSVDIAGYSAQRLMQEHSMTPIAAFLTLDWIMREPGPALASPGKGHDSIRAA